jgi:hypothetical protein
MLGPRGVNIHMKCKFCGKECANNNSHRNHERLCPQNKDRIYTSYTTKEKGHVAWNKGLKGDPRMASPFKGREGKKHTEKTKKLLSKIAKSKKLGGYRPNAGRSKKFQVLDSFNKITTLQSTYEYKCYEILNKLNIKWLRPKALKYDNKNYFADFYLVDYKIYLDPKNSYKARLDKEKIEKVIEQNNVKVYILEYENLTENKIINLCS